MVSLLVWLLKTERQTGGPPQARVRTSQGRGGDLSFEFTFASIFVFTFVNPVPLISHYFLLK